MIFIQSAFHGSGTLARSEGKPYFRLKNKRKYQPNT